MISAFLFRLNINSVYVSSPVTMTRSKKYQVSDEFNNKTIFFLETSNNSLSDRTLCAIESAAKYHPLAKVLYVQCMILVK